MNTTIKDCRIIPLDRHHSDRQGDLSVVEGLNGIPFPIRRIYYLYDIPGGATRGGHAHKNLYQILVAASGSFTVVLDDGTHRQSVTLNQPDQALLIVPGIWRELENFSSGSVCLCIASEKYDESDYLRDYDNFLLFRNHTITNMSSND
ncbi:MAG: FdtA/QdtA family cupin domain-containing protein [Bacteroidales bacterium]|nr:FdtA/QdtA family cupin domain-containing protein [Bacteroidales bacterium]